MGTRHLFHHLRSFPYPRQIIYTTLVYPYSIAHDWPKIIGRPSLRWANLSRSFCVLHARLNCAYIAVLTTKKKAPIFDRICAWDLSSHTDTYQCWNGRWVIRWDSVRENINKQNSATFVGLSVVKMGAICASSLAKMHFFKWSYQPTSKPTLLYI